MKPKVLIIETSYNKAEFHIEGEVDVVMLDKYSTDELGIEWLNLARKAGYPKFVLIPEPKTYTFIELADAPAGRYWDKRGNDCDLVAVTVNPAGMRELNYGDDRGCWITDDPQGWEDHTFFGPIQPPEF